MSGVTSHAGEAPTPPSMAHLLAIKLTGKTMQERTRIASGDIVVVDQQCEPVAGDLSCATLLDNGPRRLTYYRARPDQQPLQVGEVFMDDSEVARYEGVVVRHIRELQRATAPLR